MGRWIAIGALMLAGCTAPGELLDLEEVWDDHFGPDGEVTDCRGPILYDPTILTGQWRYDWQVVEADPAAPLTAEDLGGHATIEWSIDERFIQGQVSVDGAMAAAFAIAGERDGHLRVDWTTQLVVPPGLADSSPHVEPISLQITETTDLEQVLPRYGPEEVRVTSMYWICEGLLPDCGGGSVMVAHIFTPE